MVSAKMVAVYQSSEMGIGQSKSDGGFLMIGSMIVGFLIGLIASAISNRGERMGCIGKTFVGWLGAFVGQLLLEIGDRC